MKKRETIKWANDMILSVTRTSKRGLLMKFHKALHIHLYYKTPMFTEMSMSQAPIWKRNTLSFWFFVKVKVIMIWDLMFSNLQGNLYEIPVEFPDKKC